MSKQIIKQPNGKYCIFNSVVDNVTHFDCDNQKLIEIFVSENSDQIEKMVSDIVQKLDDCKLPYFQHSMNYEKMIALIQVVHGVKEAERVNKIITE